MMEGGTGRERVPGEREGERRESQERGSKREREGYIEGESKEKGRERKWRGEII